MYKDRGIIKWAPFDSLVGFRTELNELKIAQDMFDKPVLMEDILNEFDYVIQQALVEKLEVTVEYYEQGFSKRVYGTIRKLDYQNNTIIFDEGFEIAILDFLRIEIN